MPAPYIHAYLDYREFLKDWLEARKSEEPGYSFAAFAREGGCSKAALANVLSKARVPRPATLDAFARAMRLTPLERNYLGLLVDLDSAPDLAARGEVMRQLLATERYGKVRQAEAQPDADVERYLAHWYLPAIREMAMRSDFRADPHWIAARLYPEVLPEQVADALRTLFELDMLVELPDGRVSTREVRFRTEPAAFQAAALRFYREQLPPLMAALDADRGREQHVLTTTLRIERALLPEIKARLDAVMTEIADMGDAAGVHGTGEVYQMTVQLLPLTREVDGG